MSSKLGVRKRFVIQVEGQHSDELKLHSQFFPSGRYVLNSKEWNSLPPKSCGVIDLSGESHGQNPVNWKVIIEYRPGDFVSYVGKTRYLGWRAERNLIGRGGNRVNTEGRILGDDEPSVKVLKDVYPEADFESLPLGELIDEFELPSVKSRLFSDYFNDSSPSYSFSGQVGLSLPHRYRRGIRIVLSRDERVSNGVVSSDSSYLFNPNSARAKSDIAAQLAMIALGVCEGRLYVGGFRSKEFTFLDLGNVIFDSDKKVGGAQIAREVLPETFLNDLAMQLMSEFPINCDIVDDGGMYGVCISDEP
ncbi:MAG: hypothetical protein U0892_10610 [Pirellulales bacterium]